MDNFLAGFVTIVGRPNTGKSSLINAFLNSKVTITSHHPNTTRNPIRAILTRPNYQIIFVDTPGVQKALNSLGHRLNAMVEESAADTDLTILTLPADEEIGAGDAFIAKQFVKVKGALIIALTKVDRVSRDMVATKLAQIAEFVLQNQLDPLEIIPVSVNDRESVLHFEAVIAKHLQPSPPLYPAEITLDQAMEITVAEFIREAAIGDLRQELPHSVMVTVEEFSKRGEKDFYDIHANIHVERDSQKGILIGDKGARIKEIGERSRSQIENFLGAKIFLGLQVKVSKEWQKDPKALLRFGFLDR